MNIRIYVQICKMRMDGICTERRGNEAWVGIALEARMAVFPALFMNWY